jgi:hypothetical protein
MSPTDSHNARNKTVKCWKCWKQVRVTKDGMLYFHLREKMPYDAARFHCTGSGTRK